MCIRDRALSWLLNHPKQLGRIGRWILKLNCYKFGVQHIKGTQNVVADTLSRMFQSPTKTPENKENPEIAFANAVITESVSYTHLDVYKRQK